MRSVRGKTQTAVGSAFAVFRRYAVAVAIFSGVINILLLTGPLFMLQIYDRVLHSRSIPTLVALVVIVVGLYAIQGVLDAVRARVMARVGEIFDAMLAPLAFRTVLTRPLTGRGQDEGTQPLRDLDQVRGFMQGGGPTAFFDLPWMPVYLAVCFLLHPMLGWVTVAAMLILLALTVLSEWATRKPVTESIRIGATQSALAEGARRTAEAIRALGMTSVVTSRWSGVHADYLAAQRKANDVTNSLGAVSRAFRMFFQSALLALGAYFVIRGEMSPGAIIAASILGARALQPIEMVVSQWRGFVLARASAARLDAALGPAEGAQPPKTQLPAPTREVSTVDLVVLAPGLQKPTVVVGSVKFQAGDAVGVIGPSGCGKTSLARTLVGVWPAGRGEVRIDGATLDQWSDDDLGKHVGYLPQAVELLDGTIAENISRFTPDADDASIVKAAMAAGAHEMIVNLPEGYGTPLTDGGAILSAGQKQRIGLARALYCDPFLVVLDEPNAHLDSVGEAALQQAILGVKARKGIAIVVAHRPSALVAVDKVLVLGEGRVLGFGPKDEVLAKLVSNKPAIRAAGVSN